MKARNLALGALSLTISIPLASAYSGDMTIYTPNLTPTHSACNIAATAGEPVVAVSHFLFTAPNPNNDPLCGTYIDIYNPGNGQTIQKVKIVDKCPGCDADSIDVNVELFTSLGVDVSIGRAHGIDWGGPTVGGKRSAMLEPLKVTQKGKRRVHHPHGMTRRA